MSLSSTRSNQPPKFAPSPADEAELRSCLEEAAAVETPGDDLCLRLARIYERHELYDAAGSWLARLSVGGDSFAAWMSAAALLDRLGEHAGSPIRRSVRIALVGSYTTAHYRSCLRIAALGCGIGLEIYESPYNQFRQELLDSTSPLYASDPEIVLLAVHEGALELPEFSQTPEEDVAAEVERWQSLWACVAEHSNARVIQHAFALRPEVPLGHLALRSPHCRYAMAQAVNARLGAVAQDHVSLIDCDRIAAIFGKERWFADRYWHLAKQAVALDALPLLARHTAAVLGSCLGLSRKCLVLDLDNTLWGGVIGEDGINGIELGSGARGEAFAAFQEYILMLRKRGVVLAVVSKNNEEDARAAFEQHPDMRLRLDDISVFFANWDTKPNNIRAVAETLGIGLDSLVFVDDNPAERDLVRQVLPEVDVIPLPTDPAEYVRVLSNYLLLEPFSITDEDLTRTTLYQARAEAARLKTTASSLEDFYRSLEMEAMVEPFNDSHLARIVQLIGKTNQFNLATRRHDMGAVRRMMTDPDVVHLSLTLRDRLANHGLVAVLIAREVDKTLDIDTWLMSCRVIGRTVEHELFVHLCRAAGHRGCTMIRGTFIPSGKNDLVANLYESLGFEMVSDTGGTTVWEYDLALKPAVASNFIGNWQPVSLEPGACTAT